MNGIINKFYNSLALFSVIIISCSDNRNNNVAGGPCTYEKKFYPATVIKIEKKDSLNADIIFKIEDGAGNVYRDSVSWYMENKGLASIVQIEKDSIAIGKKYTYEVWKIITGHCNPDIERLALEKFDH